jgi:hypothetical protein
VGLSVILAYVIGYGSKTRVLMENMRWCFSYIFPMALIEIFNFIRWISAYAGMTCLLPSYFFNMHKHKPR